MSDMVGPPRERVQSGRSIGATSFVRAIGGMGQAAAAKQLGVTQTAVSRWSSGERVPGTEHRELILRIFGVQSDDWDRYVDVQRGAAALTKISRRSVRDDVVFVQELATSLIQEMVHDQISTPSEKASNLLRITQALIHVGRITGEISTITEGVIIKLPPFRSLVKKLFAALQPWPEAIKAVTETLSEIEDEQDR